MKIRLTSILIILCMIFALIPTTAMADSKAWGIRLSEQSKIEIRAGEAYQLNYYFLPEGTTTNVWFSSTKKDVAMVDEKTGIITALKPGETKIETGLYLLSGNKANTQASVTVKVLADNIAKDFEIPDKLSVVRLEPTQFPVKLLPESSISHGPIRYSSYDINKLKIDSNGLMSPTNPGTVTVKITMGNIEKTTEVTIVPEEGYMEPTVDWKGKVKEGWYVIRSMYNFLNVAPDGSVELRWQNPAPTFYVKEDDKGTTIKTADGKYIGLTGTGKNGDQLVVQASPYYWLSQGNDIISLWINNMDYPYIMVNAKGEKNADGTKLVMRDNKSWSYSHSGEFHLIPADGKNPQYVKPQVVSPFEKTKPFTLLPSKISGGETTIFGMTIGKTTVAEMKALYGEPDDVWYESGEIDNNTAWYFYRNNWTDMMMVGAEQPYDEELYREHGLFQSEMPIEGDSTVIGGIYSNKIDLNLGPNQKVAKDIYFEYMIDEANDNQPFAAYIGDSNFYYMHNKYYFPEDGAGWEIGPMQKGIYYTLNAYLATRGWQMLQLDELASFNKYKAALAARNSGKVAMLGYDTGKKSEYAAAEGEYWLYMNLIALKAKKFRAELWSGKHNTIAIGSAAGWDTDIDSWEEDDHIKEGTWGTVMMELSYQSGVPKTENNAVNNSTNDKQNSTSNSDKASGTSGITVQPTNSTVYVNGKAVSFDAYNINNSNYFKLRDLAYSLNGTEKQFEVGWDGVANAILLTSGKGYTAVGGEMSAKGKGVKSAVPTASKITLNGTEVKLTAYNINNSNYFKLRDIAEGFNFGLDWDGVKNAIVIKTNKGYGVADTIAETNESNDVDKQSQEATSPSADFGKPPKALSSITQKEWDVLRLTNIERAKIGIPLLVTFDVMQDGSQVRANEIVSKYGHTRPDGSAPNTTFDELKYSYTAFAENIAFGQTSAEEVVQGWMNSEGHKANILRESLRHMGVGYNNDSWVQLFATDASSIATKLDYHKELGYFSLKLKSGVTAYAPYDPISSPTVGGEVKFNYPGVTSQPIQESGLNIVSCPKKLEYKVGDGFDTTGFSAIWYKYEGGDDKDFTDEVEFYTSKTVKLTEGRPFTTSGKKVVEIRSKLNGNVLGTYTINVTN